MSPWDNGILGLLDSYEEGAGFDNGQVHRLSLVWLLRGISESPPSN
jgi:hypothetical protein